MIKSLVAGIGALSLAACMHTPVPIEDMPGGPMNAPLDARVWASSAGDNNISIRLNRPAYVAVFQIIPGYGTQLLYPRVGQAEYLSAGSHAPHVFGRGSGSWFRASSITSRWSTGFGSRTPAGMWTQPRHIYLVASEAPLDLGRVQSSAEGGYGLLASFQFSAFSANNVMNSLLDVVLPASPGGDWVTDVYTVWPEPPVTDFYMSQPRTTRAIWVTCDGQAVRVPAGVLVSSLANYLAMGCSLSTNQPGEPVTPDSAATSDTTAVPDMRRPDTVGQPVRPPMARRADPPRIAEGDDAGRSDAFERTEEARARASARAGDRTRRPVRATEAQRFDPDNTRRPAAETQRVREPLEARGTPTQGERQATPATRARPSGAARTAAERPRAVPSRPAAEPARTRPEAERPRAGPSRPAAEPARTRPQAERPRAEPARTRPQAERPRAEPARTSPPRRAAPPPRAEPPQRTDPARSTEPPKRTKEPPPDRSGDRDGASR